MTPLEIRQKIDAYPKSVIAGTLWAIAMSYGQGEAVIKALSEASKAHQESNRELAPIRKLNRKLKKENDEIERLLKKHRREWGRK